MWFEDFNPLLDSQHRYIAYHGGRGGLKSWHFAIALLNEARQKPLRILCLREIQKSIRDSVHKLLKDRINQYGFSDFKVNEHNIINKVTGSEIFFLGLLRNSNAVKSYEGIDRVWVEEAQAVSMESLDFLLPTIRKENSQIWFSFNRFAEDDPVWIRICKNPAESTYIKKINIMDVPKPFQSEVLIKEMQRDKIEDFDRYLHIWEGEPVGQDPQSILPRVEINKAAQRIVEGTGPLTTGVDPARYGGDEIALYQGRGLTTTKYKIYKNLKEPQVVQAVKEFVDFDKKQKIKIDLGYMPGVCDYLEKDGYNVIGINFGGGKDSLKEPDKYVNIVTEMWFDFKDQLPKAQIPDDPVLKSQLTNRLYFYRPDDRKIIESKDDYKKRHTNSPDRADGFLLQRYQPKVKGAYVGQLDHDWVGGM